MGIIDAPLKHSIASLVSGFETLGYEPCADAHQKPGFEKLALYADEYGSPTHVARQLSYGNWTSKLGAFEDIEHKTLRALEGVLYGKVVQHLRRRRTVKEK